MILSKTISFETFSGIELSKPPNFKSPMSESIIFKSKRLEFKVEFRLILSILIKYDPEPVDLSKYYSLFVERF